MTGGMSRLKRTSGGPVDGNEIGGAGGGSRPRQPIEGANTLQTNATIRVVDLIGEGELRGLVNGLQSVFIDSVPVANADGSRNVSGVTFEWRAGLPEQSPLTGIPEIESESMVNREVVHGKPLVRRITNALADSARITLRFPRLVRIQDNGDTTPAKVRFAIAVKPASGVWTTALTQTINDKNISPAELSWLVTLKEASPWDIRITRLTANSDSDKLNNKLWWARYTVITELKQSYPYSAVMGITAEADKFTGHINKREYEVYGLIVDVPSNYDPETRAYGGIWDGTFKRAWTDNPAWCLYHVLTNRRFGLGGEIADEYLTATKWELFEIARFCDEFVPDGQGGQEPRFRFTGIINKATDARKLLDHILSNFRGGMYYGGGAVVPVQDAPSDAVALLGNANVIDGEFAYSDLPHRERVSAVAMSFNDPDDGYKLGIELVVDDDLVAKYGYRQDDRVAMFCTSRAQAQRLARHILFEQENESDQLTYSTALEQASVRPGDVIKQSDATIAGARVAFRIARADNGNVNRVSLFDAVALATTDTVLYLGESFFILGAGGNWSWDLHIDRLPDIAGHSMDAIKFTRAGHSPRVKIQIDYNRDITLPDEDNRAFAFRFRRGNEQVATAWLPLRGKNDAYSFSDDDIAAITPPQTFTTDLFAFNPAPQERLEFDIALVRTDRATVDPAALLINIPNTTPPSITADDLTGVDAAIGWTLNMVLPDGSIEQRAVTAIAGNTLTLASPPSTPPLPNAMAVLESPALSPRLWRVLSVAERDELEYKFTAHAYYPDKYAAVERDIEVNTYPFSLLRDGPLATPDTVSLATYLYLDSGLVKSALTVSITAPDAPDPRALYIEYQLLAPGASRYENLDLSRQQTIERRNVRLGVYAARARYVGEPLQITSDWIYSAAFEVLGKTARPSTPTNLKITLLPDTGLSISIDPIPDLDRDEYSYWISGESDDFSAARRLVQAKATEFVIATVPAGIVRAWVQAHDTSDAINHGSVPASMSRVIRRPEQPDVHLLYEGTDIVLTWANTQTDFSIAHYLIHYAATAPDEDVLLASVLATTWRMRVTWVGVRNFTIAAVDIAGNSSTAANIRVAPILPTQPMVTAQTIDNTVLFNYASTPGSLAIDRFEVRRGDDESTATVVAVKAGNSTFTVFEELFGGTFTYWWTAIDSAGNRSPSRNLVAIVAQPPDYQLFAEYFAKDQQWENMRRPNTYVSSSGGLIMLVDNTETWRQHFERNNHASPQAQIDAGFEYYAQPSTTFSACRLSVDYGTVIDQALVSARGTPIAIDGDGRVSLQIRHRKSDSIPWSAWANSPVFITDFRYVDAKISVRATHRDDLFYVDDLILILNKKTHRDSGTATANANDVGGTAVAFNLNFIDADQPLITPGGATARIGVADFTDTPNPVGFKVFLFDPRGNRVSGVFGWQVSGYIQ